MSEDNPDSDPLYIKLLYLQQPNGRWQSKTNPALTATEENYKALKALSSPKGLADAIAEHEKELDNLENMKDYVPPPTFLMCDKVPAKLQRAAMQARDGIDETMKRIVPAFSMGGLLILDETTPFTLETRLAIMKFTGSYIIENRKAFIDNPVVFYMSYQLPYYFQDDQRQALKQYLSSVFRMVIPHTLGQLFLAIVPRTEALKPVNPEVADAYCSFSILQAMILGLCDERNETSTERRILQYAKAHNALFDSILADIECCKSTEERNDSYVVNAGQPEAPAQMQAVAVPYDALAGLKQAFCPDDRKHPENHIALTKDMERRLAYFVQEDAAYTSEQHEAFAKALASSPIPAGLRQKLTDIRRRMRREPSRRQAALDMRALETGFRTLFDDIFVGHARQRDVPSAARLEELAKTANIPL